MAERNDANTWISPSFEHKKPPITYIDGDLYDNIYVIGDIHGHVDELYKAMADVGFDEKRDLLISTGDIIDRGPKSLDALKFTDQPFFLLVQGNHERMAHDAIVEEDGNQWNYNGGNWFFDLSEEDKHVAAKYIMKTINLPYYIEVTTRDKRKIVIGHADYEHDVYHPDKLVTDYSVMWSMDRFKNPKPIVGADMFVFGHNMVKDITAVGNLRYIDTGGMNKGMLKLFNIQRLKLTVYTIQMSKWRLAKDKDIEFIDTTVKTNVSLFAPTWDMVSAYKKGYLSAEDYQVQYNKLIDERMRKDPTYMETFVRTSPNIALACFCPADGFCHRFGLADIIKKYCDEHNIECVLMGELR